MGAASAAFLTFVAAASVLVLEIAAGRLLAPYVGVSLLTYTGIIGVILAGIAAGAWAGGRAADRFGPRRLLGPTFAVGGLAAVASVPVVAFVGAADIGPQVTEIVVLAAAGFVVPATILSAVGPMIVRATIVDVGSSGALVGRLSAVGTIGAIAGTFLTGFVLLGLVPTRLIIVGTGGLLVLLGAAIVLGGGRGRGGGVAGGGVIGLLVALGAVSASAITAPAVCDAESRYYCIRIVEDRSDPDGRTLVLDGLSHAHVNVADPTVLRFGYIRRFADVSAMTLPVERLGGSAVLHVGGGGFSFPRYLEATAPAIRQTVLELDPAVVAINRARLAFAPSPRLNVVLGDARLSIANEPSGVYDLVVGDAFGGLAVPWHLTTSEFLGEVRRVLRPDGTYVMNVIDYAPLGFLRAEVATARDVFGEVAVLGAPTELAGTGGGNFVVVASTRPIDADALAARIESLDDPDPVGIVAGSADLAAWLGDAPVLTDDFAPVDQLLGR
jgi:SAM-dependent methyltransferase